MAKEKPFNVFATALCALCAMPTFADAVSAISPDGRNEIRLYARPLAYEVFRDGVTVAAKSEIGMTVDGCRMDGTDAPDRVHPAVTTGRRNGVADAPVYKKSKVDFLDRGDADVTAFEEKFAAVCAKYRMQVEYHGEHLPFHMAPGGGFVIRFSK